MANVNRVPNQLGKFENIAFDCINDLYNKALYLCQNKVDAEDLVQETYLKAYRFFDSFEEGSNFKAWIFKILYNNFISQYRKKSRMPNSLDFDDIVERYSSDSEEDDYVYVEDQLDVYFDDEIYTAIERIPQCYSIVVMLVDVYGLSYKEAAVILDCPIGTVMSRLCRARKKLRRSLLSYGRKYGFVN